MLKTSLLNYNISIINASIVNAYTLSILNILFRYCKQIRWISL